MYLENKVIKKLHCSAVNVNIFEFTDGTFLMIEAENICSLTRHYFESLTELIAYCGFDPRD